MCLVSELTNCTKANSGAPAPIVAVSLTHAHTPFPSAHKHPTLSKDEERGQALCKAKATYWHKDSEPSVFSLAKPWYVPQSGWGPLCLHLCCLVFEQADYKDDDDSNDDGRGSGLRRSSCRRVERSADNRPVYSRKGTLWIIKVAAAEWRLPCVLACLCVYVFISHSFQLLLQTDLFVF